MANQHLAVTAATLEAALADSQHDDGDEAFLTVDRRTIEAAAALLRSAELGTDGDLVTMDVARAQARRLLTTALLNALAVEDPDARELAGYSPGVASALEHYANVYRTLGGDLELEASASGHPHAVILADDVVEQIVGHVLAELDRGGIAPDATAAALAGNAVRGALRIVRDVDVDGQAPA